MKRFKTPFLEYLESKEEKEVKNQLEILYENMEGKIYLYFDTPFFLYFFLFDSIINSLALNTLHDKLSLALSQKLNTFEPNTCISEIFLQNISNLKYYTDYIHNFNLTMSEFIV